MLRQQRVTEENVFVVMIHCSTGLQYLHQRGLLHRDIKPDNLVPLSSPSNNSFFIVPSPVRKLFLLYLFVFPLVSHLIAQLLKLVVDDKDTELYPADSQFFWTNGRRHVLKISDLGLSTLLEEQMEEHSDMATGDVTKQNSAVDDSTMCKELLALAQRMRSIISVKNRSHFFRKYPQSFLGSDAVAFLMTHNLLGVPVDVHAAKLLGDRMMSCGLFMHVSNQHRLENNSNLYYHFTALIPAVVNKKNCTWIPFSPLKAKDSLAHSNGPGTLGEMDFPAANIAVATADVSPSGTSEATGSFKGKGHVRQRSTGSAAILAATMNVNGLERTAAHRRSNSWSNILLSAGPASTILVPAPPRKYAQGRVGTRQYMAPEVKLARSEYSFPADMYSLGLVCLELMLIPQPLMLHVTAPSTGLLPNMASRNTPKFAYELQFMCEQLLQPSPACRPTAKTCHDGNAHLCRNLF